MKIRKGLLTILTIVLILLTLGFIYAHVNSLASYQYEVKDYLNSETPLNEHQAQIIADIRNTKIAYVVSGLTFIVALVLRLGTPKFGGRITYVS